MKEGPAGVGRRVERRGLEGDPSPVWKEVLQNAFRVGARGGSRVLVMTSKVMVARQMKVVHIHRVEKLQLEDVGAWRLLKN